MSVKSLSEGVLNYNLSNDIERACKGEEMDMGFIVQMVEEHGMTPTHLTALDITGAKELYKIGGERKTDLGETDLYGNTPVHYAALVGNEDFFIRNDIRKNNLVVENKEGKTPLDFAVNNNTNQSIERVALNSNDIDFIAKTFYLTKNWEHLNGINYEEKDFSREEIRDKILGYAHDDEKKEIFMATKDLYVEDLYIKGELGDLEGLENCLKLWSEEKELTELLDYFVSNNNYEVASVVFNNLDTDVQLQKIASLEPGEAHELFYNTLRLPKNFQEPALKDTPINKEALLTEDVIATLHSDFINPELGKKVEDDMGKLAQNPDLIKEHNLGTTHLMALGVNSVGNIGLTPGESYSERLNRKDSLGNTPVHYACWANNEEFTRKLKVCDKPNSLQVKNYYEQTPIDVGMESGNVDMMAKLVRDANLHSNIPASHENQDKLRKQLAGMVRGNSYPKETINTKSTTLA